MVKPSPFLWVVGVMLGVILVIVMLIVGALCGRARAHRHIDSPALTHIVVKDNNPDLISKYNLWMYLF